LSEVPHAIPAIDLGVTVISILVIVNGTDDGVGVGEGTVDIAAGLEVNVGVAGRDVPPTPPLPHPTSVNNARHRYTMRAIGCFSMTMLLSKIRLAPKTEYFVTVFPSTQCSLEVLGVGTSSIIERSAGHYNRQCR
jgi:hypothetical protein